MTRPWTCSFAPLLLLVPVLARSSVPWGNLNTVLWDRRGKTLGAATDPRSNDGKAAVSTKF